MDLAIGRLHKFEGDFVLVIIEHDGRDIRATFRRDEVEVQGTGPREMVRIKETVVREVSEQIGGRTKMIKKEVPVVPHDAVWVKNRHQTPVVMSVGAIEGIVALAQASVVELTRP